MLVAIAIPVFSSQLEKSKEATDLSNIHGHYAEVTTVLLTCDLAKASDTVTVGSSITGSLKSNLPTTAGSTFDVELSPVRFKQSVADWHTASYDVATVVTASFLD